MLDRYRDQLCTFNDDIQGTAAVTTGTLLAAVAGAGGRLRDQRVAILGAGSAGCGVAEQLVAAMVDEGLSEAEARGRFFLVDRPGLLHDGLDGLRSFQRKLAQPKDRVAPWRSAEGQPIGLLDVVKHARPTILIGTSGQPGTFTEEVVRAMATYAARPIIFPLSNPTSRAEATPADLIAWTDGRAPDRDRQPVRARRARRTPVPDRPVQQQLRLPRAGPGHPRVGGTPRQRWDVHGRRTGTRRVFDGESRPGAHRSSPPWPNRVRSRGPSPWPSPPRPSVMALPGKVVPKTSDA